MGLVPSPLSLAREGTLGYWGIIMITTAKWLHLSSEAWVTYLLDFTPYGYIPTLILPISNPIFCFCQFLKLSYFVFAKIGVITSLIRLPPHAVWKTAGETFPKKIRSSVALRVPTIEWWPQCWSERPVLCRVQWAGMAALQGTILLTCFGPFLASNNKGKEDLWAEVPRQRWGRAGCPPERQPGKPEATRKGTWESRWPEKAEISASETESS